MEKQSENSMSKARHRKHHVKLLIFFYASILIAAGVSSTIHGSSFRSGSNNLFFAKIYLSFMYISSFVCLSAMMIFLLTHRKNTYESSMKSEKTDFNFSYSNHGESVNLYLRFGVAIFGLSALCHLSFATFIGYQENRSPTGFFVVGITQILFIILQTIFILLYHRLIILRRIKLSKFIFLHIAITNILTWMFASIGKISHDFRKGDFCEKFKYNVACILRIYTLPTVSEYAIIATAIIRELHQRTGKMSLIEEVEKNSKLFRCSIFSNTCVSFILGLGIVVCCIFTSVSSVVLHSIHYDKAWMYHFHNAQFIILDVIGIIIICLAYQKLKKLKFSLSLSNSSLDENILQTAYVLTISFTMMAAIIVSQYLYRNLDENYKRPNATSILVFRLLLCILEIIQCSMQTYFISEAFQRCCYNENQKKEKLGRSYVAVLLCLNFGLWFLTSLQIKNVDVIYIRDNSTITYALLKDDDDVTEGILVRFFLQTTLPLVMLYRYHSSACLSDIYSKIYETEVLRFVGHLKTGKLSVHTTKSNENPNFSVRANKKTVVILDRSACKGACNKPNSEKQRSLSLEIPRLDKIKSVDKFHNRRDTMKNMEEAQYKLQSTQIFHKMLKRKITPLTSNGGNALNLRRKDDKNANVDSLSSELHKTRSLDDFTKNNVKFE